MLLLLLLLHAVGLAVKTFKRKNEKEKPRAPAKLVSVSHLIAAAAQEDIRQDRGSWPRVGKAMSISSKAAKQQSTQALFGSGLRGGAGGPVQLVGLLDWGLRRGEGTAEARFVLNVCPQKLPAESENV